MKKITLLVLALIALSFNVNGAEFRFTDVPETEWYYNDVKNAVELDLINGKTPETYCPGDNLTYAEAVKLAACMHQLYTEGAVTLQNGEPWYSSYVEYCKKNNIITEEYDYSGNAYATRAGYMKIFANALPENGLKPINNVADNSIPDVPSSEAYAPYVYKLYRAGILAGVNEEHHCNPFSNIVRSEVAAILSRMMNEEKRVKFTLGEFEEEKPFEIITQPYDTEIALDEQIIIAVEVSGGKEPYTYQWEKSAIDSYHPFSTQQTGELYYTGTATGVELFRCIITDGNGETLMSDEVVIRIVEKLEYKPLTIKTQPVNTEAATGSEAVLTVEAAGGKAPYKYEWQKKSESGFEIFEAKNNGKLTYSGESGVSVFRCVVTDANGSSTVSDEATVSFTEKIPALEMKLQPKNIAAKAGATVKFIADAQGGKTPYTYRWQIKNGTSWTLIQKGTGYNGTDTSTLSFKSDTEGTRSVRCVIYDADGKSIISNAATATFSSADSLKIKTHPVNITAKVNDGVSVSVSAEGGREPYIYQWQIKEGGSWIQIQSKMGYEGFNTGTLSFKSDTPRTQSVRCVISDANEETIISNAAEVTFIEPTQTLGIKTQPEDITVKAGCTAKLTAEAQGGTPPYKYTWEEKGSKGMFIKLTNYGNITGAYTNELSIVSSGTSKFTYRCVITDASGNKVTSDEAKVIFD